MGSKKKQVKDKEVAIDGAELTVPTPQSEIVHFEYGDLCMKCSQCSTEAVIQKGIKNGIQVVLPTTNMHELTLVCTTCGNRISIFYKEGQAPEAKVKDIIVEEPTDESIAEDVTPMEETGTTENN